MAVGRGSVLLGGGGAALRYVMYFLPVLWMTSHLHIMSHTEACNIIAANNVSHCVG